MRHCRLPPQQVCVLPNVRGVRARGVPLRPQSKAESRQRSRDLQGNFSGDRGQTVRPVSLADLYPEEVLGASPGAVAGVRPVVQVETIRPVLPVRPPVTRPAVSLPVVRPAPRKQDLLPPPKPRRVPPPTVAAVPRAEPELVVVPKRRTAPSRDRPRGGVGRAR